MLGLAAFQHEVSKGKKIIYSFTLVVILVVSGLLGVFIHLDDTNVSATENYTTYTEVDPEGWVTIDSSTKIIAANLGCDTDTYVYKDYGISYFGSSFNHSFNVNFSTPYNEGGIGYIWALANDIDDIWGIRSDGSNPDVIWVSGTWYDEGNEYVRLYVGEDNGTTYQLDKIEELECDTTYYCSINRSNSGGTLTLYVYSDEARTTQVSGSPASVSHNTDSTFRYCYATNNHNNGNTLNTINFIVQDLVFGSPPGNPYISTDAFTTSLYQIDVGCYGITFEGDPDETVWCNNSGLKYETMDVYVRDGVSDVDWINVSLTDVGSSPYIDAGNFTLYASHLSSSGFQEVGGAGNGGFPPGGGNVTINTTTWTWSNDPFPITGDDHVYLRFKIVIPSDQTVTTYTEECNTGCDVWIGED